jgi:signal transduction histidine kinase
MDHYAPWATIALDNANLYFELRQITNFGKQLLLSLDREEVLRRLLTRLIKEFEVERGSVWLVEGDSILPIFSLNKQGLEDEISNALRDLRVPLGQGFVGKAAATGHPNFTNTPQKDPTHYEEVDDATHHTTRNIISIPLTRENKTIGVIQLLDRVNNRPFTEQDQGRLMDHYAPWATIALDNASLYEEREDLVNDIIHQMGNDLGDARVKLHFFEKDYKSFAESVRKDLDSFDESLKRELSSVNERLGRSVKYIRANLETPRESSKELVQPKELIEEVIELSGITKGIDLYNNVPDNLPKVKILRKAATLHFLEILTNASKAIANGILQAEIEKGEITITGQVSEQGNLELRFTNNGEAIPESRWETIFHKRKDRQKGERGELYLSSGYGLWRIRKFLISHDGSIKVENSGQGKTTFLVVIPYNGEE